MQKFTDYLSSTLTESTSREMDILGAIKTFNGSADVEVNSDHIVTTVPTMRQVDQILDAIGDELDYDVIVQSLEKDFDDTKIRTVSDGGDEQEDYDYEIDYTDVPEDSVQFELIIYTYNTEEEADLDGDNDNEGEDPNAMIGEDVEDLQEIKRRIKINSKGKRRIKMQCKKGFKFDGKKCVKISGSELVNKRKAIRKSVRTKRSKGSGFQKRVARLRNRAIRKRKGMGVRNFRK